MDEPERAGEAPSGAGAESTLLVAIIGGGVSGLSAAKALSERGIRSHLFDTGRKAVGGRCSSREIAVALGNGTSTAARGTTVQLEVDHACQHYAVSPTEHPDAAAYFAARPELFRSVKLDRGDLGRVVEHVVVHATEGGTRAGDTPGTGESVMPEDIPISVTSAFVPVRLGVGCLPEQLASDARKDGKCKLFLNTWVSALWLDRGDGRGQRPHWFLEAGGGTTSTTWRNTRYSHVLIAHCGKCATRLIQTARVPSPIATRYLNCRFVAGAGPGGEERGAAASGPSRNKLDIVSQFSVVARVVTKTNKEGWNSSLSTGEEQLKKKPWCYTIEGDSVLARAVNACGKYPSGNVGKGSAPGFAASDGKNLDIWTLLSTSVYASRNKCPQENIPADVQKRVESDMKQAFMRHANALNVGQSEVLEVEVLHVQLWGAALPLNRLKTRRELHDQHKHEEGYLYDSVNRLGVVGDWLLGDNVGAAMQSGLSFGNALARAVLDEKKEDLSSSANVVQEEDFEAIDAPRGRVGASGGSTPMIATDESKAPGNSNNSTKSRVREKRWGKNKAKDEAEVAAALEVVEGAGASQQDEPVKNFCSQKIFAPPVRDEENRDSENRDSENRQRNAEGSRDGAWKWAVRHKIWDYLERHDLARFPRPVHHRIPNFVDAERAADLFFQNLPEFLAARTVKVNPDTPQKQIRYLALRAGKTLLVPQPRLLRGFFSKITPDRVLHGSSSSSSGLTQHGSTPRTQAAAPATAANSKNKALSYLATSKGASEVGTSLGFADEMKVDIVVIGSVAVNQFTGARIGKGEGFAEIEYGVLRQMQQIDADTPVVTHVHDSQLVGNKEIPAEKLLAHDVCVDVIVTPTQLIRIPKEKQAKPQPTGIYWELLSRQKLQQVPVLGQLKRFLEAKTGCVLPSGPDEVLPPTAERNGTARKMTGGKKSTGGKQGLEKKEHEKREQRPPPTITKRLVWRKKEASN